MRVIRNHSTKFPCTLEPQSEFRISLRKEEEGGVESKAKSKVWWEEGIRSPNESRELPIVWGSCRPAFGAVVGKESCLRNGRAPDHGRVFADHSIIVCGRLLRCLRTIIVMYTDHGGGIEKGPERRRGRGG